MFASASRQIYKFVPNLYQEPQTQELIDQAGFIHQLSGGHRQAAAKSAGRIKVSCIPLSRAT